VSSPDAPLVPAYFTFIFIFFIFIALLSFPSAATLAGQEGVTPLPPSDQRRGDAARGERYFTEGDFARSGPPLELFLRRSRAGRSALPGRGGVNANLPYYLTASPAWNGVPIVAPNCLQCHAQRLDGKLVLGLGNAVWDYTINLALVAKAVDQEIARAYGRDSAQREAYAAFRDAMLAVGPHVRTAVVGVNPADTLALVLAAHRDPRTLEWRAAPRFPLPAPSRVIPTDVPALWLLRKKHAMFYTGSGRGDFARIMMAASLLTLRDADELRELEPHFVDVLAYLEQLEAPAWPGPLDTGLAARGERVFAEHCAGCHGTYGEQESYPNLLVDLELVGTDPRLAEEQFASFAAAIETFNTSAIADPPHPATLVPARAYVAPPLDGVWATAPYLHNGSVPTLADLLDSRRRPTYWQRPQRHSDLDRENVGVRYRRRRGATHKRVFDTTLDGHGNQGHTFADGLGDEQRRALLEYLKTL
jgi:mono/diheme cytochrome c family protein